MERLTFELKFITPAFIGGAYPGKAELRPASFIGLLRWWWRAIKAEKDIEKLYREETEIFGGHTEKGSVAGKVILRLNNKAKLKNFIGYNLRSDLHLDTNYRNGRLFGKDAGLAYLLYSTILPNREREYIKPCFTFDLTFIGKGEHVKHCVASLWCLLFLGGVGSRARRGAGNMVCIDVNPKLDYISFFPEGDLIKWLGNGIRKVKEIVNGNSRCKGIKYSSLTHPVRIAVSKKSFPSWREALNDAGRIFMDFRYENRKDTFGMGVFGLPIRHSNNKFLKPSHHSRRASPLIIKLVSEGERYRWIILELCGDFLPEGERIVFLNRDKEIDREFFIKTLDRFFKHLSNYAVVEEVSL